MTPQQKAKQISKLITELNCLQMIKMSRIFTMTMNETEKQALNNRIEQIRKELLDE